MQKQPKLQGNLLKAIKSYSDRITYEHAKAHIPVIATRVRSKTHSKYDLENYYRLTGFKNNYEKENGIQKPIGFVQPQGRTKMKNSNNVIKDLSELGLDSREWVCT